MITSDDYLRKAAEAKHIAKTAVSDKNFDLAWRYFHIQKDLYLKHAKKSKFTLRQTLALDASVHEDMANVLRQEGRHEEAFTDILYWVIAQSERPKKSHLTKLKSYFSRCKYKNVTFSDVENFTQLNHESPDFFAAKEKVLEWRKIEGKS
ncbi:hypothetical protein [Alishewanella sp. HH-ZS]|uniref:hypothetical protein n=1 Tax=Alishewanella sp. HH-ZS TaxID=1856684 RepID=UPI0008235E2D|nr:hypothetical protein [Alishewanella sp. HH-ZS]OCW98106.1 hypothetical protein A9165_03455 [Alishewanella sp. HH-ZS]